MSATSPAGVFFSVGDTEATGAETEEDDVESTGMAVPCSSLRRRFSGGAVSETKRWCEVSTAAQGGGSEDSSSLSERTISVSTKSDQRPRRGTTAASGLADGVEEQEENLGSPPTQGKIRMDLQPPSSRWERDEMCEQKEWNHKRRCHQEQGGKGDWTQKTRQEFQGML
ncbi:hypothetical protein C8R42DRAFT_641698 [Lentinula raphanica]|nr:hypothetical protein C8R42DRAFT_641698 [Lentinula raphanica]